ncbi:MAG: DUF4178 domain-containing protein [Myxococcales bacterium]
MRAGDEAMTTAFNVKAASCPACGAPMQFKVGSSRVIVCEFCQFAVARTDRGLENIGKVADLIPTGAKLTLGAEGKFEGHAFRLVGRLQYQWKQGVWDEWYASFEDGRWGWLAEAQGRYYMSFRVAPRAVPLFDHLRPGGRVFLSGLGPFVVADIKRSRYVSAAGELPTEIPPPGAEVATADLSGQGGAFATLDYGSANDHPVIFVGHEVPFQDLAIRTDHLPPPKLQKIKAQKLTCPRCQAPIALQVPDQAMRVTCRHCNALLDATQGALQYLSDVSSRKLQWKLGSTCTFFGRAYVVTGWVLRSCNVEGETYYWQEYLLYDEQTAGFRFLLQSDWHWSFVEPLRYGDVEEGPAGATWKGEFFKHFSYVNARVEGVQGEFYWAVEQGEVAGVHDYIRPPHGLSREASDGEVNWSHAVYVEPADVWAAFGSKEKVIDPPDVGVLQPWPHEAALSRMGNWALWGAVAAFCLLLFFAARADDKVVFDSYVGGPSLAEPTEGLSPLPGAAGGQRSAVTLTEPFLIEHAHQNLEVELSSDVNNSWVAVNGALINETTNEFVEFGLESSYYSGVDSDGSWVEDSRTSSAYLSDLPAGRYVMRVETMWEAGKPRPTPRLRLTSGVVRVTHFLLALLAILAPPLIMAIRRGAFEAKRWEQSNL